VGALVRVGMGARGGIWRYGWNYGAGDITHVRMIYRTLSFRIVLDICARSYSSRIPLSRSSELHLYVKSLEDGSQNYLTPATIPRRERAAGPQLARVASELNGEGTVPWQVVRSVARHPRTKYPRISQDFTRG
jgi:hypothetical protein